MKKELLVIYDLDLEYGNGLLSYLTQRKEFPYEVKLVTSYKSLQELEAEIGVLFIDETFEGVETGNKAGQVIYLSEELEDSQHINRFQSVDKIAERIALLHRDISVEGQGSFSKTEVIAVYSPLGGSGKTTLAKETARLVHESGQKAFYVDFGLVPERIREVSADFYYNLKERILFEKDNFNHCFTTEEGISYLKTSFYSTMLWKLQNQDIRYLIEGMRERADSASYIFDIGYINETVVTLLELSDVWFMPHSANHYGVEKVENMRNLLRFQKKEVLLEKMVTITDKNQILPIVKGQVT